MPSLALVICAAAACCLLRQGTTSRTIWLSLNVLDTLRALRTVRPNGRRIGLLSRRKALRDSLMCWTVFIVCDGLERIPDALLGWIPMYSVLRMVLSGAFFLSRVPASQTVFSTFIQPSLRRHEKSIDLSILLLQSLFAVAGHYILEVPLRVVQDHLVALKDLAAWHWRTIDAANSNADNLLASAVISQDTADSTAEEDIGFATVSDVESRSSWSTGNQDSPIIMEDMPTIPSLAGPSKYSPPAPAQSKAASPHKATAKQSSRRSALDLLAIVDAIAIPDSDTPTINPSPTTALLHVEPRAESSTSQVAKASISPSSRPTASRISKRAPRPAPVAAQSTTSQDIFTFQAIGSSRPKSISNSSSAPPTNPLANKPARRTIPAVRSISVNLPFKPEKQKAISDDTKATSKSVPIRRAGAVHTLGASLELHTKSRPHSHGVRKPASRNAAKSSSIPTTAHLSATGHGESAEAGAGAHTGDKRRLPIQAVRREGTKRTKIVVASDA